MNNIEEKEEALRNEASEVDTYWTTIWNNLMADPKTAKAIAAHREREARTALRDEVQAAKEERKTLRAEAKAIQKEAKFQERMDNAEVSYHRLNTVVAGLCTGLIGGAAVVSRNPALGVLAVTGSVRTGRAGRAWYLATQARKAELAGDVIEQPTVEEALRQAMMAHGVEAALDGIDAAAMAALGLQGEPVWLVLAALDLVLATWSGKIALDKAAELEEHRVAIGKKEAPAPKPGAHRATRESVNA